jgi:hypothetical protein
LADSSGRLLKSDGLKSKRSSSIPGVPKFSILVLRGWVGVRGSGGGESLGFGGGFGANKACPALFVGGGLEGGPFAASKACPPLLVGEVMTGAVDPGGWDIVLLRDSINLDESCVWRITYR